ncbi:alanine--tRNA ligase [Humidisolicoccus flavus]|uniref:alanine--tRNA ligase n=1 Tax=Humidisolicoccus flavus TaxID=3111414 RepID=UPI003244A2AD
MLTAEIHKRFLRHFEERGHTIVPSASLVSDDPTIMFTIAGMVPFIPYLSGQVPAPHPRIADVQKCIRTNDIEEVGRTPRHGTFFQMLGNWSFGDYFKRGAIEMAWELLTKPEADGGFGFSPDDLWVTVYETDDEAVALWQEVAGLPVERIQRLGIDTNYWHTGQPGPAGPCSEIFFDMGPDYGPDGGPATDHDRYVEIWNLVFMQDLIGDVRSKTEFTILGELPKKNIDTGAGLERIAFLKQGVENMYETDQVRPVLDLASELSGRTYGQNHEDDVRMRVIADHVRSSLMLMNDGVTPGNEGRGYILRRLMRRSIRAMRLLGVDGPSFDALFTASKQAMVSAYPELETDFPRIRRLALAEEETFLKTLTAGSVVLDTAVERTKGEGVQQLRGDTAFQLHDTYGFPIDLTLEIAEEHGLSVDRAAFDRLMGEQRARAKADAKAKRSTVADLSVYSAFRALGETQFFGYEHLTAEGKILGILRDGVSVDHADVDEQVEIIMDATALYAESGGQEADQGRIVGNGFELDVLDVQRPVPGLVSHTVRVLSGTVAIDALAHTEVDAHWRRGATQAHSATHLVHASLRQILGSDAHQTGSYNKAGYMRLDFSWSQALSPETRSELEEVANTAIRDGLEVETRVLPIDEAKALGAMALFGEKYGDTVRMVDIGGPWSRELCAGTHVRTSSEIGVIDITSESSVGSANRRVEALVGIDAFRSFAAERSIVNLLSQQLKTPSAELPTKIADLVATLKSTEKKLAKFEAEQLALQVPNLVAKAESLGSYRVVIDALGDVAAVDAVRALVTKVRDRLGAEASVVALGAVVDGRPVVVVATNQSARDAGAAAGALAKTAASVLGGGGGGRPDMAQGGGSNAAALPDALVALRGELR